MKHHEEYGMTRNEVAYYMIYMEKTFQKQDRMQSDDLLQVWRQLSQGLLSQALRMATSPECVCAEKMVKGGNTTVFTMYLPITYVTQLCNCKFLKVLQCGLDLIRSCKSLPHIGAIAQLPGFRWDAPVPFRVCWSISCSTRILQQVYG